MRQMTTMMAALALMTGPAGAAKTKVTPPPPPVAAPAPAGPPIGYPQALILIRANLAAVQQANETGDYDVLFRLGARGCVFAPRNDQARDFGAERRHRCDRLETVAIGQLNVDNGEIDIGIAGQQLTAGRGTERREEFPFGLHLSQHRAEPADEQGMIVDQQQRPRLAGTDYALGHAPSAPARRCRTGASALPRR